MTKGRPADPSRARRKTGNRPLPGEAKPAKAVVSLEPAPVPDLFPPPETLPEQVHPVWRAVVADLGGANNLRESYLPSIEAYVMAVYIHAQASANIQQWGLLVAGATGPVVNPSVKVQKESAATMIRFAESLGLTPAGRIRLGLMEITGMSLLSSLNSSLDGKVGRA